MSRFWSLALVLVGLVLVAFPLVALVDVPGERWVKQRFGVNVDGCGPIVHRGDGSAWRDEADTPTLRDGPSSAFLDGKIYLVGGIRSWSENFAIANSLDTVESFDVATRKWETLPPLPRALNHVNLAAAGGALYALGGTTSQFRRDVATGESWRYDPAGRRWEPLPPMPTARGAAGVAVHGDDIVVAGGRASNVALTTVEEYDTRTKRWRELSPMRVRRDHAAMAAHGDYAYVLAGRKEDEVSMRVFERYDFAKDRWEDMPPSPEPKAGFHLIDTPAGLVAAGGENLSRWTLYGGVYAFDPDSRRWKELPAMDEPKHGYAAEYANGRLYVFGGSRCSGFLPTRSSASLSVG